MKQVELLVALDPSIEKYFDKSILWAKFSIVMALFGCIAFVVFSSIPWMYFPIGCAASLPTSIVSWIYAYKGWIRLIGK